MSKTLFLLKNKYIIAGLVFVLWIFFFDRHDIATQYSYYGQLKALEGEKEFYDAEISRLSKQLQDLEDNPAEIERMAREKYQMKRDHEDIYIVLKEE